MLYRYSACMRFSLIFDLIGVAQQLLESIYSKTMSGDIILRATAYLEFVSHFLSISERSS